MTMRETIRPMSQAPAPDAELGPFFKALSDETRREILALLERRERNVTEIVRRFNLTQPTISRHLRVLRERGQAEAIGSSIETMCRLRVPIVSTVLGEGGSGGALAIGVANRVLMLEYATYSVITPEGCASILWRDGTRAADAADQLKLLARDAKSLGIIDEVVAEPASGAHRKPKVAADALRQALTRQLGDLRAMDAEALVAQRYQRFRALGAWS